LASIGVTADELADMLYDSLVRLRELPDETLVCALSNEAYARATPEPRNPNLPLIGELKKHGVEVLVCGQSLARN
jgi:hypothetical protein